MKSMAHYHLHLYGPVPSAVSDIHSGCSAAWLARLLGVQEVVGSNPAAPTQLDRKPFDENVEGLSHFVA